MLNTRQEAKNSRIMFNGFTSHGYFTRSVITRPDLDVFEGVDSSDVKLDFTSVTPDKIKQFVEQIISKSNQVHDQIAQLLDGKSRLTYSNVIQPMVNLEIATANMRCLCTNPAKFFTDSDIRDASNKAENELSRFDINSKTREDLYLVFTKYYRYYYRSEKALLTQQQSWHVEIVMATYKDHGMHLPNNILEDVNKIKAKLSTLQTDFEKNVNDDATCFYLTREQLAGLQDSWFEGREMNAQSQYKMTMKSPDIIPALEYIKDRSLRKKLSIAFNARVAQINSAILNEVIVLRHQLATLLGHKSFAQWSTKSTMIGTPEKVIEFLADLDKQITPLYEKEIKEIRNLARKLTGDTNFVLQPWDIHYYYRIYTEKVSTVDMEEIKKYFPIDVVTQGLFKIYERLLGLRFFEEKTDNKWHGSVKYFEVYDYDHQHRKLGEPIGAFFLDMHPREGKYSHGAAFRFICGYQSKNPNALKPSRLPIGTIACNFPQNGCISFNDVSTFFHEFGHIMHLLCSGRVEMPSMSGYAVEGDFIETPSQMLENWVYEPEALRLMSKHIQTNQPIDDITIQKLQNYRNTGRWFSIKRQLMLASFDMKIHMMPITSKSKIDVNNIFAEVYESTLGIDYPDDFAFPASFTHLMDDYYAAGYYGYLFSLVNAMDMYYEVFKRNPLNPQAGKHYRKTILEPGSSKNASDLLEDFLGREPSNKHYLQSLGLEEEKEEYAQQGRDSRKRVRT